MDGQEFQRLPIRFPAKTARKKAEKSYSFDLTYQFGGFWWGQNRKVSVYFCLKESFKEGIDMIVNLM